MTIGVDKAELLSLLIEATLYGLYVVSFACTIYVLIYKRSTPHVHYGMFTATVLMFVLATMHLVINFLRLIDAFSLSQVHPGAALVVFQDLPSFKNLFRSGVILAEILLGDIVLIYRCYVAWGNSLRPVILPLVILLATAVSCGGVLYNFSKTAPGVNMFTIKRLQAFIISTQALVLANNVTCTSLLAWRLWRMSRVVVTREQRHSLRSVARIIAESGLITALVWLLYITLNAAHQVAAIIVLNAIAPITGVTFCLIVSRVALNVTHSDTPHKSVSKSISTSTSTSRSTSKSKSTSTISLPIPIPMHHHHRRHSDPRTHSAIPTPMPILPILNGGGRSHPPIQINVASHESVRVDPEAQRQRDAFKAFRARLALAGLVAP